VADSPERSDDAAWSDLEQHFFASAPTDEAEAPAEPARFDDLDAGMPPRRELPPWLRRSLAAAAAAGRRFVAALLSWRPDRRGITIALASVVLFLGLSVGVIASRSRARTGSPRVPPEHAAVASVTTLASLPDTSLFAAVPEQRARPSARSQPHHADASRRKHRRRRNVAASGATRARATPPPSASRPLFSR
jgi:hypothetical protein